MNNPTVLNLLIFFLLLCGSLSAQTLSPNCPDNQSFAVDYGSCNITIYQDLNPTLNNSPLNHFTFQTAGPVANQKLHTWGAGFNGQVTTGATDWAEISIGNSHTLAISKEGKLFAWGEDTYGQLGDGGTNTNQSNPVQIGTDTDWITVETGDQHSLALKRNGKLYAWGFNNAGQLGNGNNLDQSSPVQVGSATDWLVISAGAYSSVAIKTDGSMYACGQNNAGQLGIGNNTSQNIPTRIGTANSWVKVAAGGSHVLALKASGHLYSWGNDFNGQLGDGGANTNTNSPAQVGSSTWTDIAVGDFHSFAISGGSLYAWGRDDLGQLGDGGSNAHKSTPTRIGSYGDWKQVTGGNNHSLGIRGEGLLYAWGSNSSNKLGLGTGASHQGSPVQVGTKGGWAKIAGGYNRSGAIQHSYSLNSGSFAFAYVIIDQLSNSATCSFTLSVADSEPPIIYCPPDIILPNDPGKCSREVSYPPPPSQDNCGSPTTTLESGIGSGGTFPIGYHKETYKTVDAAGNYATCSINVVIYDNEAPEISCPSNKVFTNDPGQCSKVVNYTTPVGTDLCSPRTTTLVSGKGSGGTFPVGSTQEVYKVTDAAGNTASCSFSITIEDDEDPVINCPTPISIDNEGGLCGATTSYLEPVGTDNCSGTTSRTAGLGSGGFFPVGINTETFTVTDAQGNSASCSFQITVLDKDLPQMSLLGDNPLFICQNGTYVEAGATAQDNCDGDLSNQIQINTSNLNTSLSGTYQVQYNVSDAAGNQAMVVNRQVIVKPLPLQLAPQNCGTCSQIRFDFCEGDATPDLAALLANNSNRDPQTSILWYSDNNGSKGPAIPTPNVNTQSNNTQFYWVSQLKNDCEGFARRVRVRVRKTSTVIINLPSIGCLGGQIDLAAWVSDSRNIATGFRFYDEDPNQGNPTALGTVSAYKGQVNHGQNMIVNLPGNPITYYTTALNKTGCQVTGNDEVVSNAGPTMAPIADIVVHAGDPVQIAPQASNASYVIWVDHSSFNNPYVGILGSMGMGNLSFTAYNNFSSPITSTIRIIPYNGNCAGAYQDVEITVNPSSAHRQSLNMLSFSATRLNAHDIQLDWEIHSEWDIAHVEIEKKRNTDDFKNIGTQAWQGNINYRFLDQSGMGNVNQYRLKLILADGRVIWSNIAEIKLNYVDNQRFSLFPNPNAGSFQVKALFPLSESYTWQLSDAMGKVVKSGQMDTHQIRIEAQKVAPGIYYLIMASPEGKRYIMKVVKQ